MSRRSSLLLCALGGFLLAGPVFARKAPVLAPPPPPVLKPVSSGTYRDAAGHTHSWTISQDHVLYWADRPYLPVGGAFTPQSWGAGQTDDAWNADMQALHTLRQHGVTDVLLTAGAQGLTHVPPDAVQRLLDYLDAQGFHYGLQIADFPQDPLTGYTVEPAVFRNASPPEPGQVQFTHIAGLQDAFAVLASSGGQRLETDKAAVTAEGTAQVTIALAGATGDSPIAGDVLLLYPRRSFGPGTPESHLPNLWQGYDEYRDRLITFFRQVHLGVGFRFFLDPLTDHLAMNGEVQNLVPTSSGFQRDFEAWLDTRYGQNLDQLNRQWGVANSDVPSFQVAARCVPLWYGLKGLPDLYDPTTNTAYHISNQPRIQSDYWTDLQEFKVESTRGYMDEIADALKSAVADVPVVYTWTQHSPLFTDTEISGGYDGLGMEAYGHGSDLTHGGAAFAYAQAQETPKTTWLIAAATADASPDLQTTPDFVSQSVLFDDWDALTRIGARGFYAQSLPLVPPKNSSSTAPPGPSQPGQSQSDPLTWLSAYASMLTDSASVLDSSQPSVLWYPQNVAQADWGARLLPDNVWWLPTFTPGRSLTLGPSLRGYTLTPPGDAQPVNVLWSPDETVTTARFDLEKMGTPTATSPDGSPLRASHKGDTWSFPVGTVPTLVRGVAYLPLSIDAADDAESEAGRLLRLANTQKVDFGTLDQDLFRVSNDTHNDLQDVGPRYTQFEQIIHRLIALLQPYAWVEGESSTDNTFTSVAPNTDASDGAYLSLNTDQPIPATDPTGGYHATYSFSVTAPGDYSFWMSGSPLDGSSPFTWQVDSGAPNPSVGDAPDVTPLPTPPPPSAVPSPDAPLSAIPLPATQPAPSPDTTTDTSPNSPAAPAPPAPTPVFSYGGKFVWRDLGHLHLGRGPHTLTILVTDHRPQDQRYVLDIDAFCITRSAFTPNGPYPPPLDSWLPPAPPETSKDKKSKQ